MPKLKIDTKSLFEPIEVEIDGKTFEARRFTRPVVLQIEELNKQIQVGSLDAGYQLLELLLGDKCGDAVSKLDLKQVNDVAKFIIDSLTPAEGEEKNGLKPGDKASQ